MLEEYIIKGFQLTNNQWVPLQGEYTFNQQTGLWTNRETEGTNTLPDTAFTIKDQRGRTYYYVHIRPDSYPTSWVRAEVANDNQIYWININANKVIDAHWMVDTDQINLPPDARTISENQYIRHLWALNRNTMDAISDSTALTALTGFSKAPQSAKEVLEQLNTSPHLHNLAWARIIKHHLPKEEMSALKNDPQFVAAVMMIKTYYDVDVAFISTLLPQKNHGAYWKSVSHYDKCVAKAYLKGEDLFNFYATSGHLPLNDFHDLAKVFTEDEILALMKYPAPQEAIAAYGELEDRFNNYTLLLIFKWLPPEIRLTVLGKVIKTDLELTLILGQIDPNEKESFIVNNIDMSVKILDRSGNINNIFEMVNKDKHAAMIDSMLAKIKYQAEYLLRKIPDEQIYDRIINNHEIMANARKLGINSFWYALSMTNDKAKQAKLAALFIGNSDIPHEINDIINSFPSSELIDELAKSKKSTERIAQINKRNNSSLIYKSIIDISSKNEHQKILDFPGMIEGIKSNIATYLTYIIKHQNKEQAITHLFSEEFIQAFKNSMCESFSLRTADIFFSSPHLSKQFYDHIYANIMENNEGQMTTKELCWFFLFHLKNKKPDNWLEIIQRHDPSILDKVFGTTIYQNLYKTNAHDLAMIRYVLMHLFFIPLTGSYTGQSTKFSWPALDHILVTDRETNIIFDYVDEYPHYLRHLGTPLPSTNKLNDKNQHFLVERSANLHILNAILCERKNKKLDTTRFEQAIQLHLHTRNITDAQFMTEYVNLTTIESSINLVLNYSSSNPFVVRWKKLFTEKVQSDDVLAQACVTTITPLVIQEYQSEKCLSRLISIMSTLKAEHQNMVIINIAISPNFYNLDLKTQDTLLQPLKRASNKYTLFLLLTESVDDTFYEGNLSNKFLMEMDSMMKRYKSPDIALERYEKFLAAHQARLPNAQTTAGHTLQYAALRGAPDSAREHSEKTAKNK
ncbi:MAG: hypothetical protein ACHQAX_05575 [Gammaproteobacteria bacterium]